MTERKPLTMPAERETEIRESLQMLQDPAEDVTPTEAREWLREDVVALLAELDAARSERQQLLDAVFDRSAQEDGHAVSDAVARIETLYRVDAEGAHVLVERAEAAQKKAEGELDAERARRDAAEAQLAALREAAAALMDPTTGFWSRSRALDFDAKVTRGAGLRTALFVAIEDTAEAYTRRVRAETLREAAKRVSRQEADPCIGWRCHEEAEAWLRAEAERIEMGGGG